MEIWTIKLELVQLKIRFILHCGQTIILMLSPPQGPQKRVDGIRSFLATWFVIESKSDAMMVTFVVVWYALINWNEQKTFRASSFDKVLLSLVLKRRQSNYQNCWSWLGPCCNLHESHREITGSHYKSVEDLWIRHEWKILCSTWYGQW